MDKVTMLALCALCAARPDAEAKPLQSAPVVERVTSWQQFIGEAAQRFTIPEGWIRAMMGAESGGRTTLHGRPITSPKGAIGLMQVMPDTYSTLSQRYGLGWDSYDPHNNILAGTAYLREMYERYGYPLLFAAYNAGPRRVDDYLLRGIPLPSETRAYVSGILPGASDLAFAGSGDCEPANLLTGPNGLNSPASEVPTHSIFVPEAAQTGPHSGGTNVPIAAPPISIFVTLSDQGPHADTRLFVPPSASPSSANRN
jgi:hypothetical protein